LSVYKFRIRLRGTVSHKIVAEQNRKSLLMYLCGFFN